MSSRIAQFLERLEHADRATAAKLLKLIRHRVPRFFYKYCSATGVGIEGALLRSELYLSPPQDFNDPFEFQMRIVYAGTETEKILALRRSARSLGMPLKNAIPTARRLISHPGTDMESQLRRAHRRAIQDFGVYCLAGAGPRSILMWSHYGAHHKGACLVFHATRDPRLFAEALPVTYDDEFQTINWVDVNALVGRLKDVILNKARCWEYEDEYRLIRSDAARTTVAYRPEALAGVVLGTAAGSEEIERVIALCKQRQTIGLPPLKLFHAEMAGNAYKLRVRRSLDLERSISAAAAIAP